MNIHEYANEIIFMYEHRMQGLVIPFQKWYNNMQQEWFWDEISWFMSLVYDFPSCFKYYIIIHEYAKNIICKLWLHNC